MTESETPRRGDIVLATIRFPSAPEQAKVRPIVVIQNDVGNRFSPNVIMAAISTQLPTRSYPTNLVVRQGSELHSGTGLDRDSVVQAENIATISKRALSHRIGRFAAPAMQLIDDCVRTSQEPQVTEPHLVRTGIPHPLIASATLRQISW